MNRCPNCAAQNREGAKFCTSCGFRLPVDASPVITSERSPFATTSTVPPYAETPPEPALATETAGDTEFSTWNNPPAEEPYPGLSWNAGPPPNTSVPVSDDMIAALVGDPEMSPDEAPKEPTESTAATPADIYRDRMPAQSQDREHNPSSTIDHLLKLVRDLEYGLVELGEAPATSSGGDTRLLAYALSDLQDEDELAPLRNAVATAQDRPRDVDVMLDLVLRADAIAALITERDQLKSAISLFLDDGSGGAESDEFPDERDERDERAEAPDEADVEQPDDVEVDQESSDDDVRDSDDDSQTI